jgi:hypothetical protein
MAAFLPETHQKWKWYAERNKKNCSIESKLPKMIIGDELKNKKDGSDSLRIPQSLNDSQQVNAATKFVGRIHLFIFRTEKGLLFIDGIAQIAGAFKGDHPSRIQHQILPGGRVSTAALVFGFDAEFSEAADHHILAIG